MATSSYVHQRMTALAPLDAADRALLDDAVGSAFAVHARRDILVQGQSIRQPLMLVEGWAYSAQMLRDGRRQVLHVLVPGDLIGMHPHQNPIAPATVTALTNVLLCPAPSPSPGQAGTGLAEAYAMSRAYEEQCLLRHIMRLGRLSAHERIIDWILEIGERVASAGLGTVDIFPLPATQETIADILGLTSVHVNRTVQSMRRDGLLKMQSGKVTILDRERCVRLADIPRAAAALPMGGFR